MLTPLSMTDAEYQLWRNGIPYSKWLIGDLDYEEFSETRLMPSFPIRVCILSLSSFFSLYLAYVACDDAQMWWSCQDTTGPIAGGPVDPPYLPWSICTYGPDAFARERPVGRNSNVIGYPFPLSIWALSSVYPCFLPFLYFLLSLSLFSFSSSSFLHPSGLS